MEALLTKLKKQNRPSRGEDCHGSDSSAPNYQTELPAEHHTSYQTKPSRRFSSAAFISWPACHSCG
jgi:hypothetical protein